MALDAANFITDDTPEEGTDNFEGDVSALGNTHRQFLNAELHGDSLEPEDHFRSSTGKASRGDFNQRGRGGGLIGSRGRSSRPSPVSR